MKLYTLSFLICLMGLQLAAQDTRPPYCDELPSTYSRGVSIVQGGSPTAPELPRFATTPTTEYKVQVAILRYTDPSEFPFHPSLIARYRPCEQVWVVESRNSFADRSQAQALQRELQNLGYTGAYLTELVAYQ
ncbi:MAG: hypothetical protein AAFO91_12035 [Bacteroidota bacterium]